MLYKTTRNVGHDMSLITPGMIRFCAWRGQPSYRCFRRVQICFTLNFQPLDTSYSLNIFSAASSFFLLAYFLFARHHSQLP